jgi:hypothetical protein
MEVKRMTSIEVSAPESDVDARDRSTLRARITLGLVALGLVLRLVRYLQNFPMWCDETMLAANLLDRPWTELARPLDYHQVCPLAFLVLEWVATRWLGFSEATLRLVPFLGAFASVPLFYLLAKRVLGRGSVGALVAVGVFAVSQPPIRYAAEVKPYATDLLVATILLGLAMRWRAAPERSGRLWVLAAVAPLAVLLSLPSIFLLGAIALVGLVDVAARRQKRLTAACACAYAGLLAAIGAGVGAMAYLGQYHTSPDDHVFFVKFWANAFPPSLNDPAALLAWLAWIHTGALFAYPHGEIHSLAWVNGLVLACFVVGIFARASRDRDKGVVALLAIPFALTFAAAVIRRYPYGLSPRVAQFLVPSTLILAAAGVDWLLARLRPAPLERLALASLMAFVVGLGLWRVSTDLTRPYRTPWDRTAREFARWFWEELGADSVLVCVRSDLGIPFQPEPWSYDGADQYLCYQRIFSRRHRQGQPPRWDAVSTDRPLRCVLLNRMPQEVPSFLAWLEANKNRFALRDIRLYRATRGSPVEPGLTYVVCELAPVLPASAARSEGNSTRR